MNVFYDLATSPASFNFMDFLLICEMERIDSGEDQIDLHILPGPFNGFRQDAYSHSNSDSHREKMRDEVVLPMAKLLPSCRSIKMIAASDRPLKGFGVNERRYSFPFYIVAAKRDIYPFRAARLLQVIPYFDVTITLRECDYWPTRNSRIEEWLKVARWLKSRGLEVGFVRDTAKASEPIDHFPILPSASKNLLTRAAIYSNAKLNLFVNNGPAWLCLFMAAPCAVFKMTAPEHPLTNDAYFAKHGFARGSIWPNLKKNQMVSWRDDNAADIIEEIEKAI